MPSGKTQEDLDLLDEAGREARARFSPPVRPSGIRFGARRFRLDDGLSTKPAPGPAGPSMQKLQEDARRRRAEQRERERGGR